MSRVRNVIAFTTMTLSLGGCGWLKSANPFKGEERKKETARLNEFAARALPLIKEALDDRLAFGASRDAVDKACGEAAIKIGRDSSNEDAAGAMIAGCLSGVDFPDGGVSLFATSVVEGVFVTFREMNITMTPEVAGKLARTSTSALRGELDTSPDVRAGALAIAAQSFLPAQASQSLPTEELEKVIVAAAQNMVGCILSWEPPKEEIPEITSIGTAAAMHVIAGTLAIADGTAPLRLVSLNLASTQKELLKLFGRAFASGATEGLNEAKLEVETYMLANRGLANGIATGLASTGVFTPQEVNEEASKIIEKATENIGIKIEPPKPETGYVYLGHILLEGEEPVSSDIPLCRLPPKQSDKFEIVEQMASGKNGETKPVTIVYLYGVSGEEACNGEHSFDPYDLPVTDFDQEAYKDPNAKNNTGQSDGTGSTTPGGSNTGTGTGTGTGTNTYDYWYGIGSLNNITLTYDPTFQVMRTFLSLTSIFPLKAKEVRITASEGCFGNDGTCVSRTYKFQRPPNPSTGVYESSGFLEDNPVSFELKGETAAIMPSYPREEDPVMLEIIFDTPADLGFDVIHSYVNQGGQWIYRKPLQYGEFELIQTNIPIYKVGIGYENY